MKPLAIPGALVALVAALAAQAVAQTPPPGAPSRPPWQPRPVIIVDPRAYLAYPTPTPRQSAKHRPTPHAHPTPGHRKPPSVPPAAETFERLDTSPPPTTRPRLPDRHLQLRV